VRKKRTFAQRVALGAVAGAAATILLQGVMKASAKAIPEGKPPMRKDPGEFMVEMTLPPGSPDALQQAAAKSLQLGYGMTSGALYAAIRPRAASALLEGALLGIGVWAAGYLGWLPALELMPPVTKQKPKQVAAPIVHHVIFGIAAAAMYDAMHRSRSLA
jgi:hypothetical protein